ncbi:hypothetical protein IAG41_13645 [Sphingomonas sp. JC676]|uniref:hypothetical protein n=1 Tax=Sphingomonas sp. JC676 TaxID=2768065 RepID=UPI0016584F72|nr:hypothetical protein [Sphingomonas sp. JC676]MBC9033435.1 hypothetical protein [Sphingomonas sp. JC676]
MFSVLGLVTAVPGAHAQVAPGAQPQQGENYGKPRLPPTAYQAMVIQPDTAPPPQQPERPQTTENQEPPCDGVGCPPTEAEVAEKLIQFGPDTREIYATFEATPGQFAVVGFAREGWPVSIEYEAEPDTVTVLRIKLYHHRKILFFPLPFFEVAYEANLDALPAESETGNPWHRTVTIPRDTIRFSRDADPSADSDLRVARYEVRSYRLVDGRMELNRGRPVRVPVNVIGTTVGPEVVGSLSLRNVGFDGAGTIPAQGQPANVLHYQYAIDRRYDLLKEAIERYWDRDLEYRYDRPLGPPRSVSSVSGIVLGWPWPVQSNERPGRYRVSVTGWWSCRGVTNADTLRSCPVSPNWAIAYTGDLILTK